jgi:hypothetical protein
MTGCSKAIDLSTGASSVVADNNAYIRVQRGLVYADNQLYLFGDGNGGTDDLMILDLSGAAF